MTESLDYCRWVCLSVVGCLATPGMTGVLGTH